ncbi:MAG: T9SS type A sorting domain-containing protein [bacterium]
MKKLLLITWFLSVATYLGYSQSIVLFDSVTGQLANNATILKSGVTNAEEIVQHLGVKNNTGAAINVMCKKAYINILEGTMNVFCWGICFGPDVFVSPETISIDPEVTNFLDFSGHYIPSTFSGISTIRYTFWVDGNPNDSACVNINFAAYPLGINNPEQKAVLSQAYPNPAVTNVGFDYTISNGNVPSSIIIRNVLGSVVKEEMISDASGKISFDVSNLSNGIYFYSLVVNGERIITRKMVVKH